MTPRQAPDTSLALAAAPLIWSTLQMSCSQP
jgi:hypothetical protein